MQKLTPLEERAAYQLGELLCMYGQRGKPNFEEDYGWIKDSILVLRELYDRGAMMNGQAASLCDPSRPLYHRMNEQHKLTA